MSGLVTLENCKGACCTNNPFGVCSHKYECQHHIEKDAAAEREQQWRDFINGVANAPDLPPRRR